MTASVGQWSEYPGTLVSQDGLIRLPYDLDNADPASPESLELSAVLREGARPLASLTARPGPIFNAAHDSFRLPLDKPLTVHVVNAMGVVLGDSIIGLSVLHWLRDAYPHLKLVLYRGATTPDYVEQLYHLAARAIGEIRYLPWPLADIPADEPIIDIGNFVFWPRFATLPTIDFFCEAMGIDPAQMPVSDKANRWLTGLDLPELPQAWRSQPYVLFSPEASTPVRRIPDSIRHAWIDRLWGAYRLPVLGFANCCHPHFVDLRPLSHDTASFLMWIRHAQAMVSADSAAVHAAAGFGVPTTAIFTTIDPMLRVRDYPRCQSVALRVEALEGIHSSDSADHVALVEDISRERHPRTLPLPMPAP